MRRFSQAVLRKHTRKIGQKAVSAQTQRSYQTSPLALNSAAEFPGLLGRKSSYTTKLEFKGGPEDVAKNVFPIYQILDAEGNIVNENGYDYVKKHVSDEKLVDIYEQMVKLEIMDFVLYNAQRQGRVSFYMTNYGEEATHLGTAAALENDDEIFAQYREAGVLMYRGFTIDEFLAQCFSTVDDPAKGRQMPVHYGKPSLHFQTISSPLATQIPQASGAGYALKREGKNNVCACYFGDGAASEGDFHAALNFAATLESQTLFLCRNNGYAISTPTEEQYRGDGIVARGPGYGIPSLRVDGNDFFAVYEATHRAREMSIEQKTPVLLEYMSYRIGHHSTSDDSSRYREQNEIDFWKQKYSPLSRMRTYLMERNLWTMEREEEIKKATKKDVLRAVSQAERAEKSPYAELVTDVFDKVPEHLQEQKEYVDKIVSKYPEYYNSQH